ncbi:hypothetical protein QCN27_19750 [Cereibacter sp. SYSU M97828]|nr:hypothetical protein [Cereibacter flavus]
MKPAETNLTPNPRDIIDTRPKFVAPSLARVWSLYPAGFDFIIEPAAGEGAFSSQIPGCTAFDVAPRAPGIQRMDFLQYRHMSSGSTLVIGNPPFGKNASLAIKFIQHATTFATVIAFILPRTLRKASAIKRIDRHWHLVSDTDIESDAFIKNGKVKSVSCCLQVWERRDYPRAEINAPREHADFVFTTREDADFAVQRVGANAGRLKTIATAGANASHYFVRAVGCTSEELWERFALIDFDVVRFETVANPSIAKTELVELYASVRNLTKACVQSEPAAPHDPAGNERSTVVAAPGDVVDTRPEAAAMCIAHVQTLYPSGFDATIDPSAGAGGWDYLNLILLEDIPSEDRAPLDRVSLDAAGSEDPRTQDDNSGESPGLPPRSPRG